MSHNSIIPTRRPISELTIDQAATFVYDDLIAGWGLLNATKIVGAMTDKCKQEKKRRKELKGK